jgi:LacI family transcriptional regulator
MAGVSVSTVANVLSRPSIVAPETRRRVEEAILSVGYVPSGPAQQLRGVPSPIVGSMILDIASPFYSEVNRGIEDGLAEVGCVILTCSTDLQPAKEKKILSLLQQQEVRGIIISPIEPDLASLLDVSRRGIPVVLIDHSRGQFELCAAAGDHQLGGQIAAEHLLSLGHRRIAFLGSDNDPRPVAQRVEGTRLALAAAGLDPDEALLHIRMPLHPPTIVEASNRAVEQVLAAEPRPTAILCLNDTAALGVLQGLEQTGLRVPADMSVVGYDDLSFASRLAPPLTTVSQPAYELGRAAAELLLDEMQPEHEHRETLFRPSLVVRSTTAPPP